MRDFEWASPPVRASSGPSDNDIDGFVEGASDQWGYRVKDRLTRQAQPDNIWKRAARCGNENLVAFCFLFCVHSSIFTQPPKIRHPVRSILTTTPACLCSRTDLEYHPVFQWLLLLLLPFIATFTYPFVSAAAWSGWSRQLRKIAVTCRQFLWFASPDSQHPISRSKQAVC